MKAIANNFNNPKVLQFRHEKGYGWAKGTFIDGYVGLAMGKKVLCLLRAFYVSGGRGISKKSLDGAWWNG